MTASPHLLETIAEAKRTSSPQLLFDVVPYAGFLGLTAAMQGDALITTMQFAPHLIGNRVLSALHGGTLCGLLESAAIFELLWRSESDVLPKTITLTIDYLRVGAALDTHASGTVTRQGNRVTNVRVEAWQTDRVAPVASAHAIFLVKR